VSIIYALDRRSTICAMRWWKLEPPVRAGKVTEALVPIQRRRSSERTLIVASATQSLTTL